MYVGLSLFFFCRTSQGAEVVGVAQRSSTAGPGPGLRQLLLITYYGLQLTAGPRS
jgi:hypothetical protein